jgi:hypothetical protein
VRQRRRKRRSTKEYEKRKEKERREEANKERKHGKSFENDPREGRDDGDSSLGRGRTAPVFSLLQTVTSDAPSLAR